MVVFYVASGSNIFYFLRLGARCDRALPAAFFESLLVRPSRITLLAAFPAATPVFLWAILCLYLVKQDTDLSYLRILLVL